MGRHIFYITSDDARETRYATLVRAALDIKIRQSWKTLKLLGTKPRKTWQRSLLTQNHLTIARQKIIWEDIYNSRR